MTGYQRFLFSLAVAMLFSSALLLIPNPEGVRETAGQWLLYLVLGVAFGWPWYSE